MEKLMQYIWHHRLWLQQNMTTVDGRRIQVIDQGRLNTDSGPDFFNAKILIDGRVWAGDVEIHVKASDWHKHGHDGNPAYDSVILHVVDKDDTIIRRSNGEAIPQMRMPCEPMFHKSYSELVGRSDLELPCALKIAEIPHLHMSAWLDSLAYERLYDKSDRACGLLKRFNGDWESVAYVTIARALGFGINGDSFERLALSLPLMFIGKHSDSVFSIEALLFGQSGLLDASANNEYADRLRREYSFLAHKFGLKPPQSLMWKMSRMRPGNFPHRRIATLAAMLSGGFRMLSRILNIDDVEQATSLFSPQLDGYWSSHYNFGAPTTLHLGAFSKSSIVGLTINAVAPLQMAYGITHGDDSLCEKAVNLLQSMPSEKNKIVELFTRAGIKSGNAFSSQALIQLRRQYCETHKCLYCRIGHRLLAAQARRKDSKY